MVKVKCAVLRFCKKMGIKKYSKVSSVYSLRSQQLEKIPFTSPSLKNAKHVFQLIADVMNHAAVLSLNMIKHVIRPVFPRTEVSSLFSEITMIISWNKQLDCSEYTEII